MRTLYKNYPWLYYFIAVAVLSQVSCFSTKKSVEIAPAVTPFKIDSTEVMSIIHVLAHDSLKGRALGTPGGAKAAAYLVDYLKKHGIKPYFETYYDSLETTRVPGANVVGYLEGNHPELKDEIIVLGAHFDHLGVKFTASGDSIANGANDNASGVSAILNIARYFSEVKTNGRTLIIALFDGEETGLHGSNSLAIRLRKDSIIPKAMINIDMIGTPLENEPGKVYASGFTRSTLPLVFNELSKDTVLVSTDLDQRMGVFALSDNYPFYSVLHIPAHSLSTFEFSNYPYYHKVDDEIDKLDVENMVNIINNLIPGIEKLSNTLVFNAVLD
ncbi:MAG: M28 family peptidase [Bacteroidota bacterium]